MSKSKCIICGKTFKSKTGRNIHATRIHNRFSEKRLSQKTESKKPVFEVVVSVRDFVTREVVYVRKVNNYLNEKDAIMSALEMEEA